MKTTRTPFAGWACAALSLIVFCVVFSQALFGSEVLFSPDGPPFYFHGYSASVFDHFTGAWRPDVLGGHAGVRAYHPARLLAVLLPPLAYHVWGYIVDVALTGLAAGFYLRGRGIRGVPLWAGGMAMAFSGYSFTLISAGHRGIFDMTPWAILLFACLDRAVRDRRWVYWPAAGACVAYGFAAQPDIMILNGGLAGIYGLWLLAVEVRGRGPRATLRGFVPGSVLACVVFVLMSLSVFGHIASAILPAREAAQGATPESKWIYATNWSLPPEEILEFVAPGVRGKESRDPHRPYWGRVGQAHDFAKTGQGLPNLKQHTVYLGVLQLLFAAYALSLSFGRQDGESSLPISRGFVWFWAGVWLVALLLAFGRFFPLYRLFYAIPRMSAIRAPIKFVHMMEWSTVILFAAGFTAFLRDVAGARRKRLLRLAIGACGFTIPLLLAWASISSTPPSQWNALGLGAQAAAIRSGIHAGMSHALALTLLGAALAFAGFRGWLNPWTARLIPVAVLVVDLVLVAKPYVHTRDLSAIYADNALAEKLAAPTPPPRVSFRLGQATWYNPVFANFKQYNIPVVEPTSDFQPDGLYNDWFQAIGGQYPRFLQLTATEYILAPAAMKNSLSRIPGLSVEESFNLLPGGGILRTAPERAQAFLLKMPRVLPRAVVMHNWRGLDSRNTLHTLADPGWDPLSEALVPPELGSQQGVVPAHSPVSFAKYSLNDIHMTADPGKPGILMLVDKWDPDWRVTVNGKPAECLRVNHLVRGVKLEAGPQHIRMTFTPYLDSFRLSFWGGWMILAAVGIDIRRTRRPSERCGPSSRLV